MLNYATALHQLREQLQPLYDAGEATAIAREVLSEITGITHAQGMIRKEETLSEQQQQQLQQIKNVLLTGTPMQYALGHAWFMNRSFLVNAAVLIPRPETEELVHWIIEDQQSRKAPLSILDIGTGSGCIPISLKLALKHSDLTACDISFAALEVAGNNAQRLQAAIQSLQIDILDTKQQSRLGSYDIIVSNPPYIPEREQETLSVQVREYEPGTALFVPDHDPLLFYKTIAAFGQGHLKEQGAVYCELHKDYAITTGEMFKEAGYREVELKKDINGHWRMLKAML